MKTVNNNNVTEDDNEEAADTRFRVNPVKVKKVSVVTFADDGERKTSVFNWVSQKIKEINEIFNQRF